MWWTHRPCTRASPCACTSSKRLGGGVWGWDIRLLDRGYSCEDYCPTPRRFSCAVRFGVPPRGMREENGRTFYLFDAGDGCYEEYVTEDGYRFAQVHGYETDGDGPSGSRGTRTSPS